MPALAANTSTAIDDADAEAMTFLERVRPDGPHPAAGRSHGSDLLARSAMELAVRGLLLGAGIGGILTAAGRDGTIAVVFAGVLAIGAAIAELGA
jgi:hypothetical protein